MCMGLCIVVSYSRLHLSAVQQGNKLGADSHPVFYKLNVACTPSFHTEFIADRDLSYTVVVIAFIDSTQPPVIASIDDPTLPNLISLSLATLPRHLLPALHDSSPSYLKRWPH